jgi:hypothetical protein
MALSLVALRALSWKNAIGMRLWWNLSDMSWSNSSYYEMLADKSGVTTRWMLPNREPRESIYFFTLSIFMMSLEFPFAPWGLNSEIPPFSGIVPLFVWLSAVFILFVMIYIC